MHDNISAKPEQGIIEIELYQNFTVKQWQNSVNHICQIYQEHAINKVLVSANNLARQPMTVELFEFARNLPAVIAFAIDASLCSRKNKCFIEKVAGNRGLRVRVFRSRSKALAWLDTS